LTLNAPAGKKSPPEGGLSEIIKKNIYALDIYTKK
jgi:hypothetical protein